MVVNSDIGIEVRNAVNARLLLWTSAFKSPISGENKRGIFAWCYFGTQTCIYAYTHYPYILRIFHL